MTAIQRIILHYQWAKLFSKIIFQNYILNLIIKNYIPIMHTWIFGPSELS